MKSYEDFINECTLVSGVMNKNNFLFKNRDNPWLRDYEVIRMLNKGVELAVYTDTGGWAEGINEYGLGLIYSTLNDTDTYSNFQDDRDEITLKEFNPLYFSENGVRNIEILTSKTLAEMISKIENFGIEGNYLIADKKESYEIEVWEDLDSGEREVEHRKISFKDKNYYVKTNYGVLIQNAHYRGLKSISPKIRKENAERYLLGFQDYKDVILAMSKQEYTMGNSDLNVFRKNSNEHTVCQLLLDLDQKTFYYIFYEDSSNFHGVVDKLPKNHKPKIDIKIIDKNNIQI